MWFYSFLFFSIFVAALCSAIASIKLVREQRMITYENESSETINAAIDGGSTQYNRRKPNVFRRVIIRCVMYPLGKNQTQNIDYPT